MSSRVIQTALVIVLGLRLGSVPASIAAATQDDVNTPAGLRETAKSKQKVHCFSTLVTAQNVRDYLTTEDGLAQPLPGAAERA